MRADRGMIRAETMVSDRRGMIRGETMGPTTA
jgi:hypothetical protein